MPRAVIPNPLDAKILKAIEDDHTQFAHIHAVCRKGAALDYRDVDRRLQVLRRKGLIHYAGHKTGWLTGPKEDTKCSK